LPKKMGGGYVCSHCILLNVARHAYFTLVSKSSTFPPLTEGECRST
jgi:hypothetical protein